MIETLSKKKIFACLNFELIKRHIFFPVVVGGGGSVFKDNTLYLEKFIIKL